MYSKFVITDNIVDKVLYTINNKLYGGILVKLKYAIQQQSTTSKPQ